MDICGCEEPCSCDLPNPNPTKKTVPCTKNLPTGNAALNEPLSEDPCACNPCQCELPTLINEELCICTPCECDPPLSTINVNQDPCQEPQTNNEPCICDPCECELPKISNDEPCTCDPCECDVPNEEPCTCDPCECDGIAEEPEKPYEGFSDPKDIDPLEAFVAQLQSNFNELQIAKCQEVYPIQTGQELSKELLEEFSIPEDGNEERKFLDLPGNKLYPKRLLHRIIDDEVGLIAAFLRENRTIYGINLAYNNVTDAGMTQLAPVLQECENIEILNLMNNDIGAAGILSIVKALILRSPLKSLKLSGLKFGVKGFDALTCLIMSGHVPLELDISECDLNLEGFQCLCTSLNSMDHDEDFPMFLKDRQLPIDLEILKAIKVKYNEELTQQNLLRKKQRMEQFFNFETDSNVGENDVKSVGSEIGITNPQSQVDLIDQFSATVLTGLFDISKRFQEDVLEPDTEPIDPTQFQQERNPPNIDEFIEATKAERTKDPYAEYKSDLNVPIVSKSLYSLEVDQEESIFLADIDNPDVIEEVKKSGAKIYHGQVMDLPTGSILLNDTVDEEIPDEYTAQNAAIEMLEDTIDAAGESAGRTELTENSDVIQLVLMTIVEILKNAMAEKGVTVPDLSEEECQEILAQATIQCSNLLSSHLSCRCELDEESIIEYFKTFFQATNGTLAKILSNPNIMEDLLDRGLETCAAQYDRQLKQGGKIPEKNMNRGQEIVTKFLEGAIGEAGRLIGAGDPFWTRESTSVEKDQMIANSIIEAEATFEPIVEELFDVSGKVAAAAKFDAENIQAAQQDYYDASTHFISDLFEHVENTLKEIEKYESGFYDTEEYANLKYQFISRPKRLVINRPFFFKGEDVMGAKLGDYLRSNTSLKCLHAQKWGLGEDGMITLMDGLMNNTSLVTLDLSSNGLASEGMKLLGEYLTKNPNLKHLILNLNQLKDPGILCLVENLAQSSLQTLSVPHNSLTEVGLDPLLQAIPSTQINALYLWGNRFGLGTWELFHDLLESSSIIFTDTLVQKTEDDSYFIVKNSQVRDTNYWYEVPWVLENDLVIPPYLLDKSFLEKKESTFRVAANPITGGIGVDSIGGGGDVSLGTHVIPSLANSQAVLVGAKKSQSVYEILTEE